MVFYCTWPPQQLDNLLLFHLVSSVGSMNKFYSPQQVFKSPTRKRGNNRSQNPLQILLSLNMTVDRF